MYGVPSCFGSGFVKDLNHVWLLLPVFALALDSVIALALDSVLFVFWIRFCSYFNSSFGSYFKSGFGSYFESGFGSFFGSGFTLVLEPVLKSCSVSGSTVLIISQYPVGFWPEHN